MTPDNSASDARELEKIAGMDLLALAAGLEDNLCHRYCACPLGDQKNCIQERAAAVLRAVASWNTRASPAPQGGEPSTQISQRLENIMTWLREPDWTEQATLEWIKDWVNRRPIAELAMVVMLMPSPSPAATVSEEHLASTLCEISGFGFYTNPMEGGQDAYDISMDALEEARTLLRCYSIRALTDKRPPMQEDGK